MTTHASIGAGLSQCELIMQHLISANGGWVAMPTLVHASGSYNVHSRIADLRRRLAAKGDSLRIEHRNTREGDKIHSFYRLTGG